VTLLAVEDLSLGFSTEAGFASVLDRVSLSIGRGQVLGLVGESGCGKTTLGRCVSGLSDPTGGAVYFDLTEAEWRRVDALAAVPEGAGSEEDRKRLAEFDEAHRIDRIRGQAWRRFRRNCQVVFQDSFASLNPRHLVKDIVGRPLQVYREASGAALTHRVVELLEQVGMGRQHLYRYPHQFSGGQRQRISIARALALNPELIVLDEPTSALDVSVQAQILNLLHELQQARGLAYLFITHNLSVVRHMADRIVVMYLGKVAEAGDTTAIFERPEHPYTEALLAASPELTDDPQAAMRTLEGSVPDPARPPQGCRFHTRCPWRQETRCDTERPQLRVVEIDGVPASHRVACHWAEQIESGEIQPHDVEVELTEQAPTTGGDDFTGPASVTEAL
jgi:peptide/nickel transport system ATP-binding protein